MPETSLKHQTFWYCGSFVGAMATREHPKSETQTVHVIVHYQPVETTHLEQWAGEVAVSELRGRQSQPGKLSPEMEKAEHWRMIRATQRGMTNQNVLDGPPGLDAPRKRVKR